MTPPLPLPRPLGIVLASLWLLLSGVARADEPLPQMAMLGFELVDEQPIAAQAAELQRRLADINAQLQQGLHQSGLYHVVPIAPAQDLLDKLRSQHAFVYRCNDCFAEIGERLQTRLIAVGWVQRVSNLILNINVSLHDARTGEVILRKSVDLRGNTDESWRRGVAFMLRDWRERRAQNPQYGQ